MRHGGYARALRAAVAIGLTAVLFWISDPAAVIAAGRGARAEFIVLACLLVLVDRALMAYRWLALLAPLGAAGRPPLAAVMRVFFISTFLGTFLPASVGGDAIRAYGLAGQGVGPADAVASVLMDRLLGIVSILIVAVAGAALARRWLDLSTLLPAVLLLTAGSLASLAVVFSLRLAGLITALLERLPRGREPSKRLFAALRRYSTCHRTLAAALAGSVAVQVLRVLQTYCLGLALGLALPVGVYFALVPLILLIVLMPITINGIGTTQAGFVWLFGLAGIAAAPAFALSVLFLAIAVVGNLPGGLLYLTGGPLRPRQAR